jgi:diphthine-ammonia ligase
LKVSVLFSGGKDSTYATWIVQHQGWDVATLLTLKPDSEDSLMFHYPNTEWTGLQAEALGLPHQLVGANGEDTLVQLRKELSRLRISQGASGLVSGAVASDYQKTRFDNLCEAIGLKTYAPLWHKQQKLLVEDLKRAGFRIIIAAVAAKGLDKSWLGRELSDQNWSLLEKLSQTHGIHLTGEGGEYESFVIDAPHFRKSIKIEKSHTVWKGDSGRLMIDEASLRDKPGD